MNQPQVSRFALPVASRLKQKAGLYSFFALGVFYLLLVVIFSPERLRHDEWRYFAGANNLSNGYLVTDDRPEFSNGPGYPLLLAPIMLLSDWEVGSVVQNSTTYEYDVLSPSNEVISNLKWDLFPFRVINVFFLLGGIAVTYLAARKFVSTKTALIIVTIMALHPLQLRWVPYLMTENVTPLLFSLFLLAYIAAIKHPRLSLKWVFLSALAISMLALTRVLFGYVLLGSIIFIPLFLYIDGHREYIRKAVLPLVLGLLFCTPYLVYTHLHTGKFFAWSTNGAELLYWMTSPHEGEFGSWSQEKWIVEDPLMTQNHLSTIQEISNTRYAEQNELWKAGIRRHLAAENSTEALVRNYSTNVFRLFFDVPQSRQFHRVPKLIWTICGVLLLMVVLPALYVSIRCWRLISIEIKLIMSVVLIYLGLSLLLPASPRYLIPIFPGLFIWLGYVIERFTCIEISLNTR